MFRFIAAATAASALVVIGLPPALGQSAGVTPEKLAYGKHLAQECTTCHRADSRSSNIPPIVGLEPDHFITTLKFYKTGARDNPVMRSVVEPLNDEQIEALAAYFATQKPPAKQAPAGRKK